MREVLSKGSKRNLALTGSVLAAVFSSGCGEQKPTSGEPLKSNSGNLAAGLAPGANEKQPKPAAQKDLGTTALSGCDLDEARATLEKRVKDGKDFYVYVVGNKQGDLNGNYALSVDTKNPEKGVVANPVVLFDCKDKFVATAGVNVQGLGDPDLPAPKAGQVFILDGPGSTVTNQGTYADSPKITKVEINFSRDAGEAFGASGIETFVMSNGLPAGLQTAESGSRAVVQESNTLDVDLTPKD